VAATALSVISDLRQDSTMRFEYTAIPAPTRGEKAKDAKTPTDRYALAVAAELNRMASEGWEYIRADVLPSEERSGLTGRATVYHNLLIFRRPQTAPAGSVADMERRPQPVYPAAASPAPQPRPTPHLPEAASPGRAVSSEPADPQLSNRAESGSDHKADSQG